MSPTPDELIERARSTGQAIDLTEWEAATKAHGLPFPYDGDFQPFPSDHIVQRRIVSQTEWASEFSHFALGLMLDCVDGECVIPTEKPEVFKSRSGEFALSRTNYYFRAIVIDLGLAWFQWRIAIRTHLHNVEEES